MSKQLTSRQDIFPARFPLKVVSKSSCHWEEENVSCGHSKTRKDFKNDHKFYCYVSLR